MVKTHAAIAAIFNKGERDMKYRKKPEVIEAIQYKADEESWNALVRFGCKPYQFEEHGDNIMIPTLEGEHICSPGDWVIKGVKNEFYPCKPDIFEMTYEPVLELLIFASGFWVGVLATCLMAMAKISTL